MCPRKTDGFQTGLENKISAYCAMKNKPKKNGLFFLDLFKFYMLFGDFYNYARSKFSLYIF